MDKIENKIKMYQLPDPSGQLTEIIQRIDVIEVKGDSVEHLFRLKILLKQIFESMTVVPDKELEKKEKE